MAIIHYYFENIHPFYDGNGRTGRIINILYLILNNLLDHPVLYLSRYILKNRPDYYRLLREVNTQKKWTDWIIFMLKAVSVTSQETKQLIQKINDLFKEYKIKIRKNHKFYSHDLINNIFSYPYTTNQFLAKDVKVSRMTATRYLEALTKDGILEKSHVSKKHFYINTKLFDLLQDL